MQKIFLSFILLTLGTSLFAQNVDADKEKPEWGGTIRFNTARPIYWLVWGGMSAGATITPYVDRNIGIPVDIDFTSSGGWYMVSVLPGIEVIPVGPSEKNGLFLTAKAGGVFGGGTNLPELTYLFRADIGYQVVTPEGLVFVTALGAGYDGITGFHLDMLLDLGFAWK